MKNIHTILSEYGITVPEDKKAEFDKAVAENYKTSAEFEKKVNRLTEELNAEKDARKTAEDTLKGFEGKDFDAITRERDEWQRKHKELEESHKKEKEEREFNEILSGAISEAKGRNPKAISALLDLEALRGSRNQEKDIKAALDSLRTENGYLFEDNGGQARFTKPNNAAGAPAMTRDEIMKISDRAERRAAMAMNQHLFKNNKGE